MNKVIRVDAGGWTYSFTMNSLRPRVKMKYMADDTRKHIERSFQTQRVFPLGEVYPGWFAENEARKSGRKGGWYSTGAAANTFYWQMRYTPSQIDDWPSEIEIDYYFNDYLGYVDYGVGKGRKVREIDRSHASHRKERYYEWNPKMKKTSRPIIRREMRYLSRRASLWLTAWSGRLFDGFVFRGIEGITTHKDNRLTHGGFTFDLAQ